MAATQILPVATGAVDSADVVVSPPFTVSLMGTPGTPISDLCRIIISLKDSAGNYIEVDALKSDRPALVINGAGTYRFTRTAVGGANACGVFSD